MTGEFGTVESIGLPFIKVFGERSRFAIEGLFRHRLSSAYLSGLRRRDRYIFAPNCCTNQRLAALLHGQGFWADNPALQLKLPFIHCAGLLNRTSAELLELRAEASN